MIELYNAFKTKIKDKNIDFVTEFTYIVIFFVFMGTNFLKFNLFGVNFNFARILMMFSLFLVIFLQFFCKKKIYKLDRKNVKFSVIFFIIWAIYSVLMIVKVKDFSFYIIENFFVVFGIINIIFIYKFTNIDMKKVFKIIVFDITINSIYYVFLFFIKKHNIGGFYDNSNDLATVLLLSIPCLVFFLINEKQTKQRIINAVILILQLFAFWIVEARACILGMALSIILIIIYEIIINKEKIKINKKLFYVMIPAFLIIVILVGYFIYNKYLLEISFKPFENPETSNQVRINIIYNGIYFLRTNLNWIFGIGSGNSIYYLKNLSIYPVHGIYSFHNYWLELLVTYGSLITIGFIIVYFNMCKDLVKSKEKESKVFLFFLISFIIASISSSSMITREWLWIVFALILYLINKEESIK